MAGVADCIHTIFTPLTRAAAALASASLLAVSGAAMPRRKTPKRSGGSVRAKKAAASHSFEAAALGEDGGDDHLDPKDDQQPGETSLAEPDPSLTELDAEDTESLSTTMEREPSPSMDCDDDDGDDDDPSADEGEEEEEEEEEEAGETVPHTGFMQTGPKSYRCGSTLIDLSKADEETTFSFQPAKDIAMEVSCGGNTATMFLSKLYQGSKGRCILFQGTWCTPNEFQALSGRECAKDWKRSIRHRGRSLKLLLSKGVLDVHPAACRCDSCRLLQQAVSLSSFFFPFMG